jgi:hypothetical protein
MDFTDVILLTWWFILYATMVYIVVTMLRRAAERIWPALQKSSFWRDFVLLNVPAVLGGGAAFFLKEFPVLEEAKIAWIRVGLGMTAGYFSSAAYRYLRARAKEKGVELPDPDVTVTQTVTETKVEIKEMPKP